MALTFCVQYKLDLDFKNTCLIYLVMLCERKPHQCKLQGGLIIVIKCLHLFKKVTYFKHQVACDPCETKKTADTMVEFQFEFQL